MKCQILHESSGRMRVHIVRSRMTLSQADILEYYLRDLDCVKDVKVYDRTGDATILYYRKKENSRQRIIDALSHFDYEDKQAQALVPEQTGRALNRLYEQKLVMTVVSKLFRSIFFPVPLARFWTLCKSVGYIWKGLRSLAKGKLEVSVLDAAAIGASVLRGDFSTAGSVMFLLKVGDILEEWTHKKSVDDLARSMSLGVEQVWVKTADDQEVLVKVKDIQVGDRVVLRSGGMIPLDGKVLSGTATVNQASMTGESLPVEKTEGGYVYAGTVVEEGSLLVEVTKTAGTGKYDRIVAMIEESQKLQSDTETKAFHLADRLVPYSLVGTALTYLLTRNVNRALSFLMVDFSCALKLSMPLSVMTAMREAQGYRVTVKGGKFLEAGARADTVVFDKTGTLTHASPKVERVIAFGGADETECLRLAACLEEHYPHSVANAVVNEAVRRGILHEEVHREVSYVVAHGIASTIDGKKAVIGSYHFVFEDEGAVIPEGGEEILKSLPPEYSYLYMAVDNVLQAAISISDPLREEAADVVEKLHELGVTKVCMMTGDNERTARAVAQKLKLDEYHAEVLPEDKAAFVNAEHEKGRTVIMIGDGVNDTLALSEADVGIAISDGAAIAREIADVTISATSLYELVTFRRICLALEQRIRTNYRAIIGFNGLLIALGVLGILSPASSALLHNGSTIIAGVNSMTPLLPENREK